MSLPPLKETIKQYDLNARKKLGQHFLLDLNLTKKIVAKAGDLSAVTVFEIGPGPGGLTRALMDSKAKKLIVVEMDERCKPVMEEIQAVYPDKEMQIILGDALKTNLVDLAPAPRAIIANLPYNVGTPMLINWLKQIKEFQSLTLMFQAEVVDRLVAQPGSKSYGRLSVLTQFFCHAENVMNIPARAFTPPPKIDSSVVHLTERQDRPLDVDVGALEKVTAAAFGQRRKMLRVSLKPMGGEALLKEAGINPQERAEQLTLSDFESLARIISRKD